MVIFMEQLQNGFLLDTPPGTFPLSTDSILLADFVRLPKNAQVLDLGSGCGTLGLLLCAKDMCCQVTGVELDRTAHAAALENIQRNNLTQRMYSICADLRDLDGQLPTAHFSVCVSNPPYFQGGPASQHNPLARRNDLCDADALMSAAAKALRYGGDFYVVQKPENLALLCACSAKYDMEAKRLKLVRHHPNAAISMILLQCKKGAKPGLVWEELTLHHEDGAPTEEYKRIYHL